MQRDVNLILPHGLGQRHLLNPIEEILICGAVPLVAEGHEIHQVHDECCFSWVPHRWSHCRTDVHRDAVLTYTPIASWDTPNHKA